MKDDYYHDHWEYIKQYVDRWGMEGPDGLIAFAGWKMEQMRTQKTPPNHPKRVLPSSIRNRVKAGDGKKGAGQPRPFRKATPASPEVTSPALPDYDGRFDGKNPYESAAILAEKYGGWKKEDSS